MALGSMRLVHAHSSIRLPARLLDALKIVAAQAFNGRHIGVGRRQQRGLARELEKARQNRTGWRS